MPRTWRILLVDGRDASRASVRDALARAGVPTLHEENSATQAVERSRALAYDAVIVGCEVSGATVPELIRALRADVISPPILAVVDGNDEDLENALVEAGASDVLPTPDLTPARL